MAVNSELIETLWNVNKCGRKIRVYEEYRINRNIVECKCCPRANIFHD